MRFEKLILHNVLRRKLRSTLTIFAVAIAVGAAVALVGIANGFRDSFMDFYRAANVDVVVTRTGSQRRLTSTLDEGLAQQMQALPGVKDVVPGLADIVSFAEHNLFVVPISGLIPETHVFEHFKIARGRNLKLDDKKSILLGIDLAQSLQKDVGDQLDVVEGEPFSIVGVFDSKNVFESGSILMPLADLQVLMGREGQVSGFSLSVKDPTDKEAIAKLSDQIRALDSGVSVRSTSEHVESLTEIQMAIAMAWLTSTVAIVIGTLGTLNTMFMSIQERVREIGILRAIGWEPYRVVKMILCESLTLSVLGGLLGATSAICLVKILSQLPAVNGLIEGKIDWFIVMQGMLLAIAVGLLGGLVPAVAASRLSPASAIQS